MEDRDFFDLLYQQWTKTTGAEDTYWMSEEDTERYSEGPGTWNVWAVLPPDDERRKDIDAVDGKKFIANFAHEADADFITGIHGCFADLVRRMHAALDESDRLDYATDEREGEIAELAIRVMELENESKEAHSYADSMVGQIRDLEQQLADARNQRDNARWRTQPW